MSKKPENAALAAMREDVEKTRPSEDKLETVRAAVREFRDVGVEITDLEALLSEKKQKQNEIRHRTLPDVFTKAGVTVIGLAKEGNLPAYEASLSAYYHANISADWEPERRAAGYAWLDKKGHGDIVRNMVVIALGKDSKKEMKALSAALKKLKLTHLTTIEKGVPWNTLTALVKELSESGKPLGDTDREAIGATVGMIVKLKPEKESR